jgi:hypothetical protein
MLANIWWGKPIVDDELIVFFVEPMVQQSEPSSGARDGRDIGPQFGDVKRYNPSFRSNDVGFWGSAFM